jgi:hypothetical protein
VAFLKITMERATTEPEPEVGESMIARLIPEAQDTL